MRAETILSVLGLFLILALTAGPSHAFQQGEASPAVDQDEEKTRGIGIWPLKDGSEDPSLLNGRFILAGIDRYRFGIASEDCHPVKKVEARGSRIDLFNLCGAVKDVADFRKFLGGIGVPANRITYLSNQEVTLEGIRAAFQVEDFRNLGNKAFWVVFAGHGLLVDGIPYLPMYESNPADLPATSLPFSELVDLFENQVGNAVKVMVLDACSSGGMRGAFATELTSLAGPSTYLLASQTNQPSHETPDGGYFLQGLLRGLSGYAMPTLKQNGRYQLTLEEAYDYARAETSCRSASRQIPYLTTDKPSQVILDTEDICRPLYSEIIRIIYPAADATTHRSNQDLIVEIEFIDQAFLDALAVEEIRLVWSLTRFKRAKGKPWFQPMVRKGNRYGTKIKWRNLHHGRLTFHFEFLSPCAGKSPFRPYLCPQTMGIQQ